MHHEVNLKMRTARKEKGLTQERLAELVKVEPITILRIENGRTRWPSCRKALDIAYHLDRTVEELFEQDREEVDLDDAEFQGLGVVGGGR
ncbi:putative transcriptional regulator [uncultured Mediterranean phage uvDeep-CGR2-AD3-C191]|nr:putative transcriptional regulator [uncultured Mediterranean phage uvDeep-CGR2-AD3-C191]